MTDEAPDSFPVTRPPWFGHSLRLGAEACPVGAQAQLMMYSLSEM